MNPYIEEMVVYFSIYKHLLNEKSIIIGDFNSNVIWDTKHNIRNHTTFNTMLKKVNLESAFHVLNKIAYGKENTPTLYMYRNLEKGYFWFYHAKSEWIVNEYFDIKRVQRKSEQVTETRVWYE